MSVNSPLGATQSTGAFELVLPAQSRGALARDKLGFAGLAGLVILTLVVCVCASRTGALLPAPVRGAPELHLGFGGLFGGARIYLPSGVLLVLFSLLFASYVVAVRAAERLSPRIVLGTIAALIAIVLIAPPLMSTDVFSYEEYARMFVTYHVNPYVQTPWAINLDPIYHFVGSKWINTPTVYGPVFTILSGFVDKLTLGVNTCLNSNPSAACYRSIALSTFVYKAIAAGAALVIVVLLWHAARLRGLNPVRAVAVFGLNPLVVVYGVGGGHNDLLMLAFTTLGVFALLARRERATGAMIAVGAAIKLTAALVLPFALASGVGLGGSSRRRAILAGAGVTSIAIAIAGFAYFGLGQIDVLPTLQRIQTEGDTSSIPGFLSIVLGLDSVGHVVGVILGGAFLVVFSWLLRRVWQGKMDWIDGAGWATVALLVSASSMLPWYVAWLMPLVALCTSRRLWTAGLWLTGVVQLITMVAYLPH